MNRIIFFLQFVLFLTSNPVVAQKMFEYEKDISNKQNFNVTDIVFKVPFKKKDSIKFYGSLITPKANFDKAVIIVPGSGADTRYSHYKLTEELLAANIAVFRYDERGIGDSEGKYSPANNTIDMMSMELLQCIKALNNRSELKDKKIGLLGHSQGGMVTMEAYTEGIPVDFMVQWATPVQKHGKFLEHQLKTRESRFNDVFKYKTTEEKLAVMAALHKVIEENKGLENHRLWKKLDKEAEAIGYTSEHYEKFPYLTLVAEKAVVLKDFEPAYKSITLPVLYIVGTEDVFVDPAAETKLLESFGNPNITIKKMQGLNHYLTNNVLLQDSTMYNIDKKASDEIVSWINKL